jgi:hypothetical protein
MRNSQDVPKPSVSRLRCAIYTRKSTEEGLDQEFNSLDAQREAGEAFIQSQRREGWIALAERYDDGGFTGANMDRPALTKLLHAAEVGELDCVVVWGFNGEIERALKRFEPSPPDKLVNNLEAALEYLGAAAAIEVAVPVESSSRLDA